MATFRDALLPVVDQIRGIPAQLGLYRFTVTVRVRTWVGGRPGTRGATSTDVDTSIKIGGGKYDPKVAKLSSKDVVASSGKYTDADLKIGPLTPAYTGGGVTTDMINPSYVGNTEVFFKISGPGFPTDGAWFKRIGDETAAAFHYYVIVRQVGAAP